MNNSYKEPVACRQQLHEAEERYRVFTELTSDFCHVCTRQGNGPYRVHWVGGQFERISGYSSEELLAIGCWLPLVHEEDQDRVRAALFRMEPGDEGCIEFRIVRKDQTVLWIREHNRCIEASEDPGQLRLYGSARDITLERESAQAVQSAEAAYRSIFNAVNDAIFILDPASKMIMDCNRQALQLFARPREELIGATPIQLTPLDLQEAGQAQAMEVMQAAAGGQPQLFEWPCSRPDGSSFWAEVSLRGTEINGRSRLLAVVRDITERKQAAQLLEASERRFRSLIEQIPNLAVQGYDRHRKIIFWNDASADLYGFSRDEALGQQLEETIIPEPMRQGVIQAVQNWIDHGTAIPSGELELQRKDGRPVSVFSSHALQLNSQGEPELYCIDVDLSEQKRISRQLAEASRAADAANRAKSEFLANMSHEVRTPLNGIMGISQLLRTTELTAEQQNYLDMLDNSSRNLLSLINDILDISKIEAGSLPLTSQPFSPGKLLREVVDMYTKVAAEKGIELQQFVDAGLPAVLTGDPLRLRQILVNLLGNAVKFTSHGGVSLRVGRAANSPDGIRLFFEVSDSGIGMTMETLQKIFNPFTQADASIARLHGGSGLGLAICRRLSELMGGIIHVESSLGHGSRFRVELPFIEGQTELLPEQVDHGAISAPLGAVRLLLVEDQDVNRTFVQRLLERQGHQVIPAADGLMALDLLERGSYDLMLLDIQMPGMGGEEVLARLRAVEQQTGVHLPVIALTAHALAGDREKLLAQGFDGYVAKPVQIVQLVEEMSAVCSRLKRRTVTDD